MTGTQLRTMGTTAQFAPVIKRGIATLTDGRVVALVIDTNLAGSGGTDVTGVAKIHLYVSNDTTPQTWTLATSYTPPVPPASSTRAARAAMSVGADNSIWVAWQGTDDSFNVTRWTYSAGVVTFGANQVIASGAGIVDRYRCIDIDVTGNANVIVGTYEANASSGSGAWHRIYVRMNSGTFVRAEEEPALPTGQFIRAGSEDITVAWRGDGIVSNVGCFVMYGTKTHTSGDVGDLLREMTFNVSTGTTDSAVTTGTWSTTWNKDQAAGTRRALLFSLSASMYMIAGVIGAGVPKFYSAKIQSGTFTAPTLNTAGYISSTALSNFFKIDTSANIRTYWSANYKDNRLLFGFAGVGTTSAPRIFREVSMTWDSVGTISAKAIIDLVPRPLDSAFYGDGGPIAIWGGDNRRLHDGLKYYNFVGVYGPGGNTLSTTVLRRVRFVSEDVFDAPFLISPYSFEPTSRPSYRVRVENVNLQPNLYGKIEVNVASNSTFTTSLKTIIEDDSKLRYFGSKDGLSGGVVQVVVPTPGPTQALTQGTWYWRARVVSDKNTPGAWSGNGTFQVSHPPTATAVFPTPASVVAQSPTNSYTFVWNRSDTEPTDTQTAYKVVVRRLDTMLSIVDTGFVTSSSFSPVISIDPVSLGVVEVPLDWTVQLKDADGVTGPASTPVQFKIGPVPSLIITAPTVGVPVDTALPTVTWSFTGAGDRVQRAYRVSVYENQTPNLLTNYSFESGAMTNWIAGGGATPVASTAQAHSGLYSAFVTPNGVGAVSSIEGNSANEITIVPGQSYTAEAWVRATTVNKPTQIAINWYDGSSAFISSTTSSVASLAGAWQKVIVTGQAPVGAAKARAMVALASTPAAGDTFYVDDVSLHSAGVFDDDPVVTTGWRVGTDVSYTFTAQVLIDGNPYRIVVDVQDTGGLTTFAEVAINTDWSTPALAGGMSVNTPDQFKVRIAWTDSGRDPDFVAYRVYRRYMKPSLAAFDIENSASTWYLVYETDQILTNYTFDDYLAPLNKPVDYAIVQLADRFGSLVESNINAWSTVTLTADRYFFVPEVNLGGIASFESSGVTGDNFNREIEQEVLHVVGRGRQMQVGDDLGYSGTLTIKLRNPNTARRDREFLELISSQYNKVYIKTPFGDVVLIALGNVQTTRQGGYGGHADFADLSVPYMQIIDDSLIVRPIS